MCFQREALFINYLNMQKQIRRHLFIANSDQPSQQLPPITQNTPLRNSPLPLGPARVWRPHVRPPGRGDRAPRIGAPDWVRWRCWPATSGKHREEDVRKSLRTNEKNSHRKVNVYFCNSIYKRTCDK